MTRKCQNWNLDLDCLSWLCTHVVIWLTNAPHRLWHLNTWPLLVALFGELVAPLLEEVHRPRWALRISAPSHFQFPLCFLLGLRCDVSCSSCPASPVAMDSPFGTVSQIPPSTTFCCGALSQHQWPAHQTTWLCFLLSSQGFQYDRVFA